MVFFKYFFPLFLHCHKPLIVSFQSSKVRESPRNLERQSLGVQSLGTRLHLGTREGEEVLRVPESNATLLCLYWEGSQYHSCGGWWLLTHQNIMHYSWVKKFRHVEIYQILAQMKEIKHSYEQRFLHQFQGFYFTSIWMITQRTGENIYALFWEL